MSDWLSMEQRVSERKAEAKGLADQYLEWRPPPRRRGAFAWLSGLLRRRPRRPAEEPQPVRPAFR